MPGFPLAALGAGLGEWARNAQQQQLLQQNQQDQQLRRQLQMMQLRDLLQKNQSARTAADAAAGFLTGGGAGIGPVNPTPGLSGGPVGVPMSQAAPAAIAADNAFNAPPSPRPSLPSGVGGAVRSAGDAWLQQNAPFPTQGRAGPQPPTDVSQLPWQSQPARPESYAGLSGPGAPSAPSSAPSGMASAPPPRAGPNTPPAGIGTPPPEYDPATTAAAIKRAHPGISNEDLVHAVDLVGKELGPKVKGAYDRWKTQAELYYRGRSADTADRAQAETERYHGVEAGLAGQRIAGEAAGRAETGRHNVAGEELGRGQLAETTRAHDLTAQGKDRAFSVQAQKAQAKTTAEVAELKTLANQARELYAAVEQNPNLVGAKGVGSRVLGGIGEQLGMVKEDPAAAELKAQIGLLQARLQKPLLGARYFSAKAQEQISQLVPALGRLDNPTAVKSALRNLAEQLEGKAGEVETTTKGVYGDAKSLSDDALREQLKQMGIEPAH